jgi:predicted glycosyltransferase
MAERPRVVCSVRDILVGGRSNQARHDQRACELANRSFDAIMVHSDPPAVVVPYAEGGEDEQRFRADRLAGLGVLHCLPADSLAARLVAQVCDSPVARVAV